MAEHWTDEISDTHLRCLVLAARGLAKPSHQSAMAWFFVGSVFFCGSTVAAGICKRLGVDLETKVKDIANA